VPLASQIFKEYATKDFNSEQHELYCGIAATILYELGPKSAKALATMDKKNKLKGQNIWMLRYLCYKYWVEFFVKGKKKKKKQPKEGGKSQWDKAADCAKKMTRLDEEHPLGHALYARSALCLLDVVGKEKIIESVETAVEKAEARKAEGSILPRFYYETMVHCGVAMYQIGEDGAEYYAKAKSNAPHGATPLCDKQMERITSQLDEQKTREALIEIHGELSTNDYKKALPVFEFELNAAVADAASWKLFDKHAELKETGEMAANITKPDAAPKKPKPKAAAPAKTEKASAAPAKVEKTVEKTSAKAAKSHVPDTDDSKVAAMDEEDDGSGVDDVFSDSVFRHANLCADYWPKERLTFSMPFDDASEMGEALILLLRKKLSDAQPTDDADLVGKLHWGGEDALEQVLDACAGKTDPLSLGLLNFAYTFRVNDPGLGSDDHQKIEEPLLTNMKALSYEGLIGLASLKGLQCNSFEAEDYFNKAAKMKDAAGSDWLYHRHFGHYLLAVKEDAAAAVKALAQAYAQKGRDPMTIGWYCAALAKTGDTQTLTAIFDDLKLHDADSDMAVMREEFVNLFDIRSPQQFDALAKSGSTAFLEARKLLCTVRHARSSLGDAKGFKAAASKVKPSGGMFFKIATSMFVAQARWLFTNSLSQCINDMTNAGMSCMDWIIGSLFMAYANAKKEEWDNAGPAIEHLPNLKYLPMAVTCAGMMLEAAGDWPVAEDLEMNKALSPSLSMAYVNSLRFVGKKDSDAALKQLTSGLLKKHKQNFNGLVALADILLSRGAVQAAYGVYWTLRSLHPKQYAGNFLLRLKFAEAMRLNGFVSAAVNEFGAVYACFDSSDKKFKDEMGVIADLLAGYALALVTVGDFESAQSVLKSTNPRDKMVKMASAAVAVQSNDAALAKDAFSDAKDAETNPLMLALGVRAGKMAGEDTAELEAKLKALLGGKFAAVASLKAFCEAALAGNDGAAKVSRVADADAPQIGSISEDYGAVADAAAKEIEAMKAGKAAEAPTIQPGKGGAKKKGKKKGAKAKKAGASAGAAKKGGGGDKAGPRPKVNYEATPFEERKQWAFGMAEQLPTPRAGDVGRWGPDEVADFVQKVPIFGLHEWYAASFRENGVTGKMFLECDERALEKWGVDRKCHRARFRAEALAMKRRG